MMATDLRGKRVKELVQNQNHIQECIYQNQNVIQRHYLVESNIYIYSASGGGGGDYLRFRLTARLMTRPAGGVAGLNTLSTFLKERKFSYMNEVFWRDYQ